MGKLLERLKDASRSGVYRVSGEREVVDAARELPLKRISLRGVSSKEGLLGHLAATLQFPDWFGNNWDAVEDCLTEAGGYLLFSDHEAVDGDEFGVLIDVLASVAEYWAERGEPFFAIFVDPARRLKLSDLFREA